LSERLEETLAGLSFFEPLRIGEIGRLAQKFEAVTVAPGSSRTFDASAPRMVVVVSGSLDLDVDLGHAVAHARLSPGDTWGVVQLLSGRTRSATTTSRSRPSTKPACARSSPNTPSSRCRSR
jgi:hypothetical protein